MARNAVLCRPCDGAAWRNPLAEARFTRLSDFAGTEQAAAISRGGKPVAFRGARNGRIDAWTGEIGQSIERRLWSWP